MDLIKPYEEKKISDLSSAAENVSIIGTVVTKDENGFVIDDGSNSLQVIMENNVVINSYIRVYGKIVSSENDQVLYGEAVQDMSKIDKLLYKKVKKIVDE